MVIIKEIIRIRAETTEIENRKSHRENQWKQKLVLEKNSKINATKQDTKKIEARTQVIDIRMKEGTSLLLKNITDNFMSIT